DRRAARPRKPMRVLIVVGGLLLAVNVWIIAGVSQRTNREPTLPSAVEELIPKPGDLVSPQSSIGVNLRNDLSGALQFDGAEIPQDQLVEQPTEGILTFSPGPGKDLGKLPQGRHTITVVYWPRASTREQGSTSFSWRFEVGA
ncbi:MAG: hypothetical protein QOC79_1592, partial [Actinomycetota bacterium]|nr:hypothetical protein [Actinomycetota bacterium]